MTDREIPLRGGGVAIVDEADFEMLNQYKWSLFTHPRTRVSYARGTVAKWTQAFMHRFIMGLTDRSIRVDHKNGNGLDNRRSNLRIATASQNRFNADKNRTTKNKYKGIWFKPQTGRWSAQIRAHGQRFHLGFFDTPEEAARAYDQAAKEKHGEYAKLNFTY